MNLTPEMAPKFELSSKRKSKLSRLLMNTGTSLVLGILFLTSCATTNTGSTEVKNEQETSIDPEEFPLNADQMLARYWPVVEDEEYYRQLGPDNVQFEKKFVSNGDSWSIAFTSEGDFIDAELLIPFDQISTPVKRAIVDYLDNTFDDYDVTRTQLQYLPEEDEDRDELDEILEDVQERDYEDLILNYEIEVEGENASTLGRFELLFDSKGELIQSRKIIDRPSDNIWYR